MKGYLVTLTTANTNYNLLTLVRAIDSAFVDRGEVRIQATDDSGPQKFLFGGADLDATHYGFSMLPGDWSPPFKGLLGLNVRCDTDGKTLNISVGRER
jgi:hypothetical protein